MSIDNADIFPDPLTVDQAAGLTGVELCNIAIAVGFRAVNRGVPMVSGEYENPNEDARQPIREYEKFVDARQLAAVTKAIELREKLAAGKEPTDAAKLQTQIEEVLLGMSEEARAQYMALVAQGGGSPFEA